MQAAQPANEATSDTASVLPLHLARQLYIEAGAEPLGWQLEPFAAMLAASATRHPADTSAEAYLRTLHLHDLALAQACARGYEPAWKRFLEIYRPSLRQAAIAISKSVSIGEEMADSLYAELFGLKERDGERRSPFASYGGRGSLMGWLRATLAQRYVDRFRRTYRESPLEDEHIAPQYGDEAAVAATTRIHLELSIHASLRALAAEERFLLASYFLDGRTLLEIARLLHVHEATISRKLKRLLESVRKQLLRDLQRRGLSKAAAQEALGTDPRDLSVHLRKILQTGAGPPFSEEKP